MEGIFWTMCDYAKAFATMNQETLVRLWRDPVKKKNLVFFLTDMIIMWLMGTLIALIFRGITDTEDDEKMLAELRKQGGWNMWLYGVLDGSTQDGPVNQIMASLFSSFDPPSYTALKTLYNSTCNAISGDINGVQWLERNFGATREVFAAIDYARSA